MGKESLEEKISVLYIDDEVENLNAFKAAFRRKYKVFIADSAAKGREILDNQEIEIILTDQRMPEMTGVEFLASIVSIYPDPMRMLMTGYSDLNAVIDAVNQGHIYKYIAKPWNDEHLKTIIDQAYEVFSLRKENKQLTAELIRVNGQLEFMLRQKLSAE